MAVHVDFSAITAGATWQNVQCEKCKKHYHYPLVREAKASVRAAYGIRQGAAEERAAKTAQYKLMKLLEQGVEIVPCPSCGWVQQDMIREARRRTARWLIYLAALCFIAGLALAMYPLGELLSVTDPEVTPAEKTRAIVGLLIGTGAAVALLIVRRMLQSTVNPNSHYPKPPEPIPGMPAGIPGKAPRELLGRTTATDVSRRVGVDGGLLP